MGDIMELTNKIINSFLCLSAAAAIGAGCTYLYNKKQIENSQKYGMIDECRDILDENGVSLPEGIDEEVAVLKGYLQAYGDKYTYYIPQKNGDEEYLSAINSLSCLLTCGYKVHLNEDQEVEVYSVAADSVAEKQGLKVGDVILSVDGESFAEKGISPTALNLSGKDGTMMHLVLRRDGKVMELDFLRSNDMDLTNNLIHCRQIDDVAYVGIEEFDTYTSANFNGEALPLIADSKKVLIDLRDNPGGVTKTSVEIADNFVGDASAEYSYYTGKKDYYKTSASDSDIDKPVVVLVNEKTASAAEVLTAFLKQYGKNVTVVGVKTFGKGIFQEETDLSNGGKLHYTAGTYTVGDWECYQGKGIEPDVTVEMDRSLIGTEKDVQLKKALELLG